MNLIEAQRLLISENIDPFLYSFGPPKLAECSVIEKSANGWIIYVWERGQKKFIREYIDESEAALAFVTEIRELNAWSSKAK